MPNHFNQIRLKFFMKPNKPQLLTKLLDTTDHLHTVTSLLALSFASSSAMTHKLEQNIAALAGILQLNMGSLKKVIVHISQIINNMKQGFQATKQKQQSKRWKQSSGSYVDQ